MSRYDGEWPRYVPVAERRRKAERAIEKLRKKGTVVSPVKIEGRQIATTFWGKAWCDNLESYRDYENRVERGRTYVRNGSVVDLQIAQREVTATVSGSSLYKIKVSIAEVPETHWKSICADCSGKIDSLVELLQGRFSKAVMERICRQGSGLFPKLSEIRFSCSCLDHASMCKHVAAALYGVGARLDTKPELLFRLRAVDERDLLTHVGEVLPMSKRGLSADKVLETDDIAALFGLDMDSVEHISIGHDAQDSERYGKIDSRSRRKRGAVKPELSPEVAGRKRASTQQGARRGPASGAPVAVKKAVPIPTAKRKAAAPAPAAKAQVSARAASGAKATLDLKSVP
jgi:uncharacterized Zn finger protein